MRKKGKNKGRAGKSKRRTQPYPYEFRIKMVRLYLWDNGGNLNHRAVNQVLEEAFVISINSPPNTSQYNGAIEHTQGEFKDYLRRWEPEYFYRSKGQGIKTLSAAGGLVPRRRIKVSSTITDIVKRKIF